MGLKPTNLVFRYSVSNASARSWPKCSLQDSSTALSMGSSLFAGFDAAPAQSSASSCEYPRRVHSFAGNTRISAVVSVPVLSEQRTFIDAISCKAVKWVTMAARAAIFEAPMTMVTCITRGRAIGTAPMTRASTPRSALVKGTWRWSVLMYSTTAASTREMRITARTTCRIFTSKTPMLWPDASCTSPAACPISVRRPVSLTSQWPSPCLTMQPESSARPAPATSPSRSGRGTLRGTGSPVSAAVSTSMGSPSSHSESAGTTLPPRRKMMSPGTNSATGVTTMLPSRFTGTVAVIWDLSASSDCFALLSSRKPMSALTTSIRRMMENIDQSSVTAESAVAMISMMGIIPVNCRSSMRYHGSSFSGISFRPYCCSRAAATCEVSPANRSSAEPGGSSEQTPTKDSVRGAKLEFGNGA
mmetsp:Transcript_76405/g.224136  ORF Transcript_76405/g.224136 Transcript_76405/m.224136 type:complete len:416 (-) Transcript_76405:263-1510(-)